MLKYSDNGIKTLKNEEKFNTILLDLEDVKCQAHSPDLGTATGHLLYCCPVIYICTITYLSGYEPNLMLYTIYSLIYYL